ncbi:MAG TPA: PHP domain-containing protein, partial [Anaerolineales bacterium]
MASRESIHSVVIYISSAMFIHLRAHSYYSFLDGLASPVELAQAAAQLGMPALALTDVNSLTGAVEFSDACQAAGVRPILGMDLKVRLPRDWAHAASGGCPEVCRLALLAMDLTGWRSLCRLSSAAQEEEQALPFERLAEDAAGLICLSGGRGGLVAGLLLEGREPAAGDILLRLAGLFPGRLYAELQMHTPQDAAWVVSLAALAKRLGLPTVASHAVHYLIPAQAHLQRVASAIRRIQRLEDLPEDASAPPESYFTSQVEMEARFGRLGPEFAAALAASQEIADRCRLELPLGKPHYPEISLPPGYTSLDMLRQKAEDGALRRYGEVTPPVRARLDHELSVIGECGYAALFLIMEEIVQFARRSGVPISSRGSAASSLVAHCLGITSPDPLRLNLYFERFLNPARATPPDIDTDLCSRRRDGVIHFVYERFGQDRVAMVSTINRFRRRSALREVAKAHGLSPSEIKKMTDSLPHRWFDPQSAPSKNEEPFAELAEHYATLRHQAIFQDAAALLGKPHHLSLHPGGVVISSQPMTDLVPTLLAAKGMLATQFDLESIERLGLIKIDLLGIRGLSVLGDVAQAIQDGPAKAMQPSRPAVPVTATGRGRQRRQLIEPSPLDILEAIPEDDP